MKRIWRPSIGQAYRAIMSAAFLVALLIMMGWLR